MILHFWYHYIQDPLWLDENFEENIVWGVTHIYIYIYLAKSRGVTYCSPKKSFAFFCFFSSVWESKWVASILMYIWLLVIAFCTVTWASVWYCFYSISFFALKLFFCFFEICVFRNRGEKNNIWNAYVEIYFFCFVPC